MRIGALARAGGVNTKTVRYYEQRGLLPPPPRTSGGFRDYPDDALDRLRFIRSAQSAGLTLAEIGEVLSLRDAGQAPCAHVGALLRRRLAEVERRLADLRATRGALESLAQRAAGTDPASCAESEICTILAPSHQAGGG